MIIMNLEADNLFSFKDFKINFSYPKKIVNSSIDGEFLTTKTNFRYKKVNIIMGGNASGKTSLGKLFVGIFNFLVKGSERSLKKCIGNEKKKAYFSIDFLLDEETLYRVKADIKLCDDDLSRIDLDIYKSNIRKNDSYEMCVERLKLQEFDEDATYLEKIKILPNKFGWFFSLTDGSEERFAINGEKFDIDILTKILQSLDTDIKFIKKLKGVENSFVIKKENYDIIVQNGELIKNHKLSSGTIAGIEVARLISTIKKNSNKEYSNKFYYCDEKFSFIHSEIEKALLSVIISLLNKGEQLFFTTHNSEILEMDLPRHSFTFLKKSDKIEVVYPEDYIKKNDVSLYNAVRNDVFNCSPSIEKIFEIEEMIYE